MLAQSRVQAPSPSGTATGSGAGAGSLIDISQLASLLTQARGPILDRLSRQLKKLTGDGSQDVTEWLDDLERLCGLEKVDPADLVGFLLEGEPARLHRRMSVADASQWDVVRATLVAEYAMPLQVAWRRFAELQLEGWESVDVYLDRLERLGGRLGISSKDMVFRTKFYEGLPSPVYEWAVGHESAYTAAFDTILSRVRDRMASRKVTANRPARGGGASAAAAATGGSGGCYRCGQVGHRVKACPVKGSAKPKAKPVGSSSSKSTGCFRCGGLEHVVKDCPRPRAASTAEAASAVAPAQGHELVGFYLEGVQPGGASSRMETV